MVGKEDTKNSSKKTDRVKRDRLLVRALREVYLNQEVLPSNEVTDANATSEGFTELSDNAQSPAATRGRNA